MGTGPEARCRGPAVLRALGATGLALALAGCGGSSPSAPAASISPATRPDFVLVVTDDLDPFTAEQLPRLPGLLAEQGTRFTRAFVTTSVCAPSRASILTGSYTHNHRVFGNMGPAGGFPAFRRHEAATLAVWLRSAGYRTGLVGKYMNDYASGAGEGYVPPGWDEWYGHLSALEDGRYFDYWVNENGTVVRYGSAEEDYSADVETRRAVAFIREAARGSAPFFLYLAPEAPHIPARYAERHGSEFRHAEAPRVPSFNEDDVRDKPYGIRQTPLLTDREIEAADKLQQWRLRSMLAVEEMVAAVIDALAAAGRLERTYVLFTSDNGLLMGQHRVVARKGTFYEECVGVPLLVRGPGVRRGGVVAAPVLNVDLAPTIAALAGLATPAGVDGRSFAGLLRGEDAAGWRTEVLLEGPDDDGAVALRTPDWLFAELGSGELEVYDMRADPWQLESLHESALPSLLEGFRARARALAGCRGAGCN